MNKISMTDEYFNYVAKYQTLYGKDTVVLLQNGSFFEMYAIDNSQEQIFTEIRQVCETLDIFVSRKNKSILENGRHNPLMAGFPTWSYQKHIQNLLDNEYTVVIFEQKEISKGVFERVMTEVLSPSIQLDYQKSIDGVYCVCFYMNVGHEYFSKVEFWNVSCSIIDITTGKIYLYDITHSRLEKKESVLFDMIRITRTHPPREIILVLNGDSFDLTESFWRKELSYHNTIHIIDVQNGSLAKIFENGVTLDKIKRNQYQIDFFNRVYCHLNIHTNINKIEYLNLEKNQHMRISLLLLLQFVYNHNKMLLEKVQKPEWCEYLNEESFSSFCKIENNSMEQIGLFYSNQGPMKRQRTLTRLNCVFDVLNETKTAVGYRFLKENLCKPLTSVSEILKRNLHIQIVKKNSDKMELTRTNLSKICDIERIHRKIQLKNISCSEFCAIENSYKIIYETAQFWHDLLSSPDSETELSEIARAIQFIGDKLFVENCNNTARNQPIELQIFKSGTVPALDQLFKEKSEIMQGIEQEKEKVEKILNGCSIPARGKRKLSQILAQPAVTENIKLEYTEKEKHYFSMSHTKCKFFQEHLKATPALSDYYKIKTQASNCKLVSTNLEKMNEKYGLCVEQIDELSKKYFSEFVQNFNDCFESIFMKINYLVGYIDFIQSGAYVSLENRYTSPQIVPSQKSFVDCVDLRHPLIEKILQHSVYIPNDICLARERSHNSNTENETLDVKHGYLIFGTNSCGKSVFMKSVGIAVIMAQIGYDVACSEMVLSPFYNIITRMSGNDDPLKGHSSFAVEMIELNLILSRATERSLVLGDEICHGTEQVSGQSLVASSLIYLCNKKVPFVFASHLHQLSDMECIRELKGLALKHLSVRRESNLLVYERKLKAGSGDATYGIEVAKYIIDNPEFITMAEKIQKQVQSQEANLLSDRISRYNRVIHMEKCQICGSRASETHHINQQKDADENKMVEASNLNMRIHMNHYANLVALCEKCHLSIHAASGKKLLIHGYNETIRGLELKFEWSK